MKKLISGFFLGAICCLGLASNAFAKASCYCRFKIGALILATSNTNGGYTQIPDSLGGCSAQTGCHGYCNGLLAGGGYDALAAAHRCGPVTITIETSVGTGIYCDNGTTPRTVTGTGIYHPAVAGVYKSVCTCKAPWSNNQNVVGGVESSVASLTPGSKSCKIQVAAPITPGPGTALPPNNTGALANGIYWRTWGNTLYEQADIATCVSQTLTQASAAWCQ